MHCTLAEITLLLCLLFRLRYVKEPPYDDDDDDDDDDDGDGECGSRRDERLSCHLVSWLHTEMVYRATDSHPSK